MRPPICRNLLLPAGLLAILLLLSLPPSPGLGAEKAIAPEKAAEKDLTVKLPAAGDYLIWLEAQTATGPQSQAPAHVTGDRASVPLPPAPSGLKEWRLLTLDEKTGYVASKSLPTKDPASTISFTTPEFDRVHRVHVQVTGAGDKPVAGASVTLTDSKGNTLSRVIDSSSGGLAEFTDVPSGAAKLAVTDTGGKTTTKDVAIDLPKGEKLQTIALPLPEVTAVVEPTAGTPSSSPAEAKTGESKTSADGKGQSDGKPGNPDANTFPATPSPPPSGGGGFGSLVGLIILAAIAYVVYLRGRNEGWTIDKALARLGVQPVPAATAGSPSAAPTPAPPADPNVCAFCGQRKDPVTGACGCSLDASGAETAFGSPVMSASGSGPRLVAVSGLAMGQIFPVAGETSIGRDSASAVPLAMDTTVSRRHAVVESDGSGFVIRDQGSSNGTYVNGARVTEAPLRPGDEVSIGGTRFRFEA